MDWKGFNEIRQMYAAAPYGYVFGGNIIYKSVNHIKKSIDIIKESYDIIDIQADGIKYPNNNKKILKNLPYCIMKQSKTVN